MLLPPLNFWRIKDIEVAFLQNLIPHLIKAKVSYFPITSPPALSSEAQGTQDATGQYSYVYFIFPILVFFMLSFDNSTFFLCIFLIYLLWVSFRLNKDTFFGGKTKDKKGTQTRVSFCIQKHFWNGSLSGG